jgi:SAM-dependent methyltransferase
LMKEKDIDEVIKEFGKFDFVMSEGVLHHLPEPKVGFKNVAKCVESGGELMVHVYRRLGPIREFTDNLMQSIAREMKPEECYEWCKQFTKLGEVLRKQRIKIKIPDVPALGWVGGEYDLQEFVYNYIVQCYWDWEETLNFEENNMENFDWFYPNYASRHTIEEVVGWFVESGFDVIGLPKANFKGVTVIGKKRRQ